LLRSGYLYRFEPARTLTGVKKTTDPVACRPHCHTTCSMARPHGTHGCDIFRRKRPYRFITIPNGSLRNVPVFEASGAHRQRPRSQGTARRGINVTYSQISRARALACADTDI